MYLYISQRFFDELFLALLSGYTYARERISSEEIDIGPPKLDIFISLCAYDFSKRANFDRGIRFFDDASKQWFRHCFRTSPVRSLQYSDPKKLYSSKHKIRIKIVMFHWVHVLQRQIHFIVQMIWAMLIWLADFAIPLETNVSNGMIDICGMQSLSCAQSNVSFAFCKNVMSPIFHNPTDSKVIIFLRHLHSQAKKFDCHFLSFCFINCPFVLLGL